MHGFAKFLKIFLVVTGLALSTQAHAAAATRSRSQHGHTVAQIARTAMVMMEKGNWKKARDHLEHLIQARPNIPAGKEALYLSALCSFRLENYDWAHDRLTDYISSGHPKYFEDAITLDFEIAERFRAGAKRHLFGSVNMPKWLSAYDQALESYDNIIAAMPGQEIAAKALFGKGWLLYHTRKYRESAEAFQTFLSRHYSHEASASAFLWLARIYVDHQLLEVRNPDLQALAEVNLERYRAAFPQDGRIKLAEKAFQTMHEIYAQGLLNTAEFYGKLGKPEASIVYLRSAIQQFPDTEVAKLCEQRLREVDTTSPYVAEIANIAEAASNPKASEDTAG